jgi:dihydroxyacetone kinase phosphotransfer subunit
MAVAGGIDDPDNPIGTDAMKVLEAIESVYSDDGVVVLMDLGSALLSAEMALEFLSDEQRPHVHLCPAPLVEGALAAAVQASVGASAAQVMAEALGALAVKVEHMGGAAAEPGSGGAGGQRGGGDGANCPGGPQPVGAARPTGGAPGQHGRPVRRRGDPAEGRPPRQCQEYQPGGNARRAPRGYHHRQRRRPRRHRRPGRPASPGRRQLRRQGRGAGERGGRGAGGRNSRD